MSRTVTVLCGIPSGLVLRTYEKAMVEGLPHAVPDRTQIELKFGENVGINADQIQKWLEANKDGDIVLNGLVSVLPDVTAKVAQPLSAPVVEPMVSTDPLPAGTEDGVQTMFTAGAAAESEPPPAAEPETDMPVAHHKGKAKSHAKPAQE